MGQRRVKGNKIISSNCNYPAASFPRIMGRLLLLPGGREWGSQDSDTETGHGIGWGREEACGVAEEGWGLPLEPGKAWSLLPH